MDDLYQSMIIDHGRSPRNFGRCDCVTHEQSGSNPLCGDQLTLSLEIKNNQVVDACFEGEGCAISVASASLMTDAIKGLSLSQVTALFERFRDALTCSHATSDELGKLEVLLGVKNYPMRVKCATLAWHTLQAALEQQGDVVTTEDA